MQGRLPDLGLLDTSQHEFSFHHTEDTVPGRLLNYTALVRHTCLPVRLAMLFVINLPTDNGNHYGLSHYNTHQCVVTLNLVSGIQV